MLVPKKDDNPVRMVIPIYRWACNHSWKVTTSCDDLCPSKELQHLPNVVTCNPSRRVIHVHQRLHRFTKSHTILPRMTTLWRILFFLKGCNTSPVNTNILWNKPSFHGWNKVYEGCIVLRCDHPYLLATQYIIFVEQVGFHIIKLPHLCHMMPFKVKPAFLHYGMVSRNSILVLF